MKFVGRISGVVSYSDNTSGSFAATRDERGNISSNSEILNEVNVAEIMASNDWLETMLSLVSTSLELVPTSTAAKTVTSAALHFSGRVSRDNQTWEDFSVSYDTKTGPRIDDGSGTRLSVDAYDEFTDEAIVEWLEGLVGPSSDTYPTVIVD